jgi:hypothetical protein
MRKEKPRTLHCTFCQLLDLPVRLSLLLKEKQAIDPGRFGHAKSNRSPVGPLMASVK